MNKLQKIVLIMLLIPNLAMAESYLCIGEAAGGVKFDEITGKALGTSFKTTDKYIIKKKYSEWQVNDFGGQSTFSYQCNAEGNFIHCDTKELGRFIISTDRLRYINYSSTGWRGPMMIEGEKITTTPYIEVGSCSEI